MNHAGAFRTLVLVGLVCLLAGATGAHGAQPRFDASPEFSAAIALGDLPVAAWHVRTMEGGRIAAAAPAEAPAGIVGPTGPGHDGAPAAAALDDGSVMLVASRHTRAGSRVWSRVWSRGPGWSNVVELPRADAEGHHPAVAATARGAWAVWVSGNSARGLTDRLVAAYWDGASWGRAESLPPAPGGPMAPTVAIDRRGEPTVLWAASDGHDAEIWATRRVGGRWSLPRQLTDNATPDITPRAATSAGRVTVAWSTLESNGYVPYVARARARDWSPPRRLSTDPGNAPVAIGSARPTVLWTRYSGRNRATSVIGKELVNGRWQPMPELGVAYNARLAGVADPRGRVATAWHTRGGLRVSESRADGPDRWRLRDLRGAPSAAAEALEVDLPGTYLGFGDSITEGLVRYDDEISFVDPYTTFLATYIADFVDAPFVSVDNSGISGELTSEGTNRLAAELLSGPTFVLLMEGANDAANLIDAAVTAANLEFMVQRSLDQGVLPLLATITPRTEFNFTGTNNERIVDVNTRIREFAPLYRVQIVDQYSAFFRRAELYSDVLHPSDEGYVHMAQVWFEALRPILKAWQLEIDENGDADRDSELDRLGRRPPRRPHG